MPPRRLHSGFRGFTDGVSVGWMDGMDGMDGWDGHTGWCDGLDAVAHWMGMNLQMKPRQTHTDTSMYEARLLSERHGGGGRVQTVSCRVRYIGGETTRHDFQRVKRGETGFGSGWCGEAVGSI